MIIIVEDVVVETKEGKRHRNKQSISLYLEQVYFVQQLEVYRFIVLPKKGYETKGLLEYFCMHKTGDQTNPTSNSHCVNVRVLTISETGAKTPGMFDLHYFVPL